MEYDVHSSIDPGISIEIMAHTGNAVGAEIDTEDCEGLEYLIYCGAALVGGGFDFYLQEAPDDGTGASGTYVAVPEANILGALSPFSATIQAQLVATDTDKVLRLGSVGKERFQRIQMTETGTVTAGVVGVLHTKLHKRSRPVADVNT